MYKDQKAKTQSIFKRRVKSESGGKAHQTERFIHNNNVTAKDM